MIVTAMVVAQGAPYQQNLLQTDYYSICLYGANYDYTSIYPLGSGVVGTYGLSQAGAWRTTIGQKTQNNLQEELFTMYQNEGTLASYDIRPISDTAAYGHPLFVGKSSLYLMYFGGYGLEPGNIFSSNGHYDMIIDLGNDRCCYLSSDSYEGLKDMVNHALVGTTWGQFVFPQLN